LAEFDTPFKLTARLRDRERHEGHDRNRQAVPDRDGRLDGDLQPRDRVGVERRRQLVHDTWLDSG
jgi:hypothetical protein